MSETFGIHPLAVQDALREQHPPKVEIFDSTKFVLLRGLDSATDTIDFGTSQLAGIAGPNFIVTRHNGPSSNTDWLWQRVQDRLELVFEGSTGLALSLMKRVVRRHVPILLDRQPRLEQIESDIFQSPRDTDAIIEEITGYNSDLKRMRRLIAYRGQVAMERDQTLADGVRQSLSHEIRDLREQLEHSATLSDLYTDLAGDLVNADPAIAPHHLNQIFEWSPSIRPSSCRCRFWPESTA